MITILTTNLLYPCSLPPSKITDFCHLPHQMEAHADNYALKNIVGDDAFHRPVYYLFPRIIYIRTNLLLFLSLSPSRHTPRHLSRQREACANFYVFKRISRDYPGIVLSIIFSAFIYITTNSLLSRSLSFTICTTRHPLKCFVLCGTFREKNQVCYMESYKTVKR